MATFKVQLPVANIFKFTVDGRATDERMKYDQQRYWDAKHATVDQRAYFELYEKAKAFKLQAYTNFPAMWIELINCDGAVYQTINGSMIREYRNQNYYSSCKFSSVGGKLFVFFMNETVYSDSTWTTVTGQVGYGGKLPAINAEVGDQIRFELAGTEYISTITELGWSPTLQAEGYVVDYDITLIDPVDGNVDIAYDAKPVDLFEVNGDMSLVTNGLAFVRMKFGLTNAAAIASYTSEPLDVQVKHEDALPIKYRHNGEYTEADVWNFEYPPGWYSTLMVPANMYQLITAGELEADVNDTGVQRKTRAIPYRQIQLNVLNIPGWIMDKLLIIFSHDALLINEYFWEIENYGSFEGIQQVDLGSLNINLRQKDDRTIYEAEFEQSLDAYFEPEEDSAPYTPTEITIIFHTNTGQLFSIINLPPWMTLISSPTFGDGASVIIDIAENETLFPRSVTLIAQSDQFGNTVQAEFSLSQDFDDSVPPPQFLEVSATGVSFVYSGGDVDIVVNASGPWSVLSSTGYAFTYTEISPTVFRITAPANEGFSNRNATVTLALDANSAVNKVITIEQLHPAIIESAVAGGSGGVPMDGGIVPIMVTTTNGTVQWQATIPNPFDADWLSVSTSIKTGSQSINVTAHHNPLGYSRSGMVLFTNVNIPGNTIAVTISQNAE